MLAAREHVISNDKDLDVFLRGHPLHHLYGGEHAFLLDRYTSALNDAGFETVNVLSPLKSPINLFPYTIDSLRAAIVEKLSRKIPAGPLWRVALGRKRVLSSLLSLAEHFDNRPGRLYSFVCHKSRP